MALSEIYDPSEQLGHELVFDWLCADCHGPLSVRVSVDQGDARTSFGTSSPFTIEIVEPWPITQVRMQIECQRCGTENGHIATKEWLNRYEPKWQLERAKDQAVYDEYRCERAAEREREWVATQRREREDRALDLADMLDELG